MRFRKKKHEKEDEEKFGYSPSKFFIVSAISIMFLLTVTKASPLCFAFGQTMMFLTFAFDVETQKEKFRENVR
jgi:hypothetical protein